VSSSHGPHGSRAYPYLRLHATRHEYDEKKGKSCILAPYFQYERHIGLTYQMNRGAQNPWAYTPEQRRVVSTLATGRTIQRIYLQFCADVAHHSSSQNVNSVRFSVLLFLSCGMRRPTWSGGALRSQTPTKTEIQEPRYELAVLVSCPNAWTHSAARL